MLVEFAIVLPILLMVIFGLVSFGIIFNHKLSLTDGAREAARFGATLPVTNFSGPSQLDQWLDAVAARAVADATGSLDPSVASRSICVAYVHPNGTAAGDTTRRRLDAGGVTSYVNNDDCFADTRPADERRVQVLVGRDTELIAIVFSMTVSLTGQSVSRFEASLISS